MNMAKRPVQKIDFRPYGAAIKAARTGQKESRNKVGDEMYLSPRYLANIENKRRHPSLQIFFELMSRYHISVDQLLFGDTADGKSTARRQLDVLADELTDREIGIHHCHRTGRVGRQRKGGVTMLPAQLNRN